MAASYPVASAAATTLAIGIVAGGFGALHDYCRGYALLAALAGAYARRRGCFSDESIAAPPRPRRG